MMKDYAPRLVDKELDRYLELFGAVFIVGPKWCGKTTTARRYAKSMLNLQDENRLSEYQKIADMSISLLLRGDTPLLIDEWQIIPRIWDAVRFEVDERGKPGQFILAGSTTIDKDSVKHSGAGRIARLRMSTMSTCEQGKSTGDVSLKNLFDGQKEVAGTSKLGYSDLAKMIVSGGWPATLGKSEDDARDLVAKYCEVISDTDISTVDGRQRDSVKAESILRSASRGISAPVNNSTLCKDVSASMSSSIHANTVSDYIAALEKIYIIDNLPAWCPNLRSKTAIRTSPIRQFADPAIAAYYLNASSDDLQYDPGTFGLLFESMIIRDLRAYAQAIGGKVFHYRDGDGLEADAIVHLKNKWAAFEVKLSSGSVDAAAENLKRLRGKVDSDREHAPSFLAVITGTEYAYTRKDGVHVIPIGCLKE